MFLLSDYQFLNQARKVELKRFAYFVVVVSERMASMMISFLVVIAALVVSSCMFVSCATVGVGTAMSTPSRPYASDLDQLSEGSTLMSGNARADLALIGRRAVLEAKGVSEEDILKELATLEMKVSKWRDTRHALPPELANMLTIEERTSLKDIDRMTYGEYEKLVTELSERKMKNDYVYSKEAAENRVNATRVGVAVDEEPINYIDQRELAKRHGATDADLQGETLEDVYNTVKTLEQQDNALGNYNPRSYSKIGKKKEQGEATSENSSEQTEGEQKKQAGFGRFNSLREHPKVPKPSAEDKVPLNTDGMKTSNAKSRKNSNKKESAKKAGECSKKEMDDLAEEIEAAKLQGVDVNTVTFSAQDRNRVELDYITRVQEYHQKKKLRDQQQRLAQKQKQQLERDEL